MATNEGLAEREFKCLQCGSILHYKPGTDHLVCQSCGTENKISTGPAAVVEEDFQATLRLLAEESVKMTARLTGKTDRGGAAAMVGADEDEASLGATVYKCSDCGAETTRSSEQTSAACPFCAAPQVETQLQAKRLIPAKYVLPFGIEGKDAIERCRSWISGLWFAPSDLKLLARLDRMQGVYVPAWTFDTATHTIYQGARGTAYYVTVERDGKRHSERRISWMPVAGQVFHKFDDVVVVASRSLPEKEAHALEPWDFRELRSYDRAYLAGFRSEAYQIDLPEGFEKACAIMRPELERLIRMDIGGDAQRIHSVDTRYSDTTFKHLLVPIWISAYRYRGKVYRVLVNARTGEVQGHRPYSWIKIVSAVLATLVALWLMLVSYEQARYGEMSFGARGAADILPAMLEILARAFESM